MSQFDIFSFLTQLCCFLLGYLSVYLFITYYYIPKYAEILKFRERLVRILVKFHKKSLSFYETFLKKIFKNFK